MKLVLIWFIFILIKSLEQSSDESILRTRLHKTTENDGGDVIFDDMSDSKQKAIDTFLPRKIHKYIDVYLESKSCFDLLKRTKRNDCNKKFY